MPSKASRFQTSAIKSKAKKAFETIMKKSSSELSLSSHETIKETFPVSLQEKNQETVLATIRRRPKAVFWSCCAIWILVVSAYTNTAGNSILGIPRFRQDFGHLVDGDFVLHANWQAAFYGGGFAA